MASHWDRPDDFREGSFTEFKVSASIIVPTYRRYSYLLDTAEALLSQTRSDIEVIIVDQNTCWPEALIWRKKRLIADSRIVWLKNELGVVNARNKAAEHARGDVFIFLDDDVVIENRAFLEQHLSNYNDPSIDAVLGREISVAGDRGQIAQCMKAVSASHWQGLSFLEQALYFPRDSRTRVQVCCFCTCNASVRKSSFLKIGGFDESFEGASYGDDYDFAIRLCASGGKINFDPSCGLVHLKAVLGGLRLSDDGNMFTERDKALSGLIFAMRHARGKAYRKLFYSWVLRRTLLLRSNLLAPWRLPRVLLGVHLAYRDAKKIVAAGPKSRFDAALREKPVGTRSGR